MRFELWPLEGGPLFLVVMIVPFVSGTSSREFVNGFLSDIPRKVHCLFLFPVTSFNSRPFHQYIA